MARVAALPARAVIEVAGEDRVSFLQGLVSNDMQAAAPGRAIWTALLSPQGKWLADFFVLSDAARLLLDCESVHVPMLTQRLARFRLRAKVTITASPWHVYAAWEGAPGEGAINALDPRLPEAGWRLLSPMPLAANASDVEYDSHRLSLGLPDGLRDLESEKTVLLEAGFDELNGVSWTKGCYMGQELTARTKYRGLVKRRLVPVAIEGVLPSPGTPIRQDAAEVGTMRSGRNKLGMALLRLEALERKDTPLTCGETSLIPRIPQWMRLPETAR